MKVYIVINIEEIDAKNVIQGVFANKKDAEQFWSEFRSDKFYYEIKEHEVIE